MEAVLGGRLRSSASPQSAFTRNALKQKRPLGFERPRRIRLGFRLMLEPTVRLELTTC
jgi:hypothetical protein